MDQQWNTSKEPKVKPINDRRNILTGEPKLNLINDRHNVLATDMLDKEFSKIKRDILAHIFYGYITSDRENKNTDVRWIEFIDNIILRPSMILNRCNSDNDQKENIHTILFSVVVIDNIHDRILYNGFFELLVSGESNDIDRKFDSFFDEIEDIIWLASNMNHFVDPNEDPCGIDVEKFKDVMMQNYIDTLKCHLTAIDAFENLFMSFYPSSFIKDVNGYYIPSAFCLRWYSKDPDGNDKQWAEKLPFYVYELKPKKEDKRAPLHITISHTIAIAFGMSMGFLLLFALLVMIAFLTGII